MGIKTRITSKPVNNAPVEDLTEKLYREERNFRADRLVEKWCKVPEVGRGIDRMPTNIARNLAILLENQSRVMSRMNEAQLSTSFSGYSPENMLRLIRLSYPNSIREQLFSAVALETMHDSIKYVMPVYTNSQWGPEGAMGNRFDDGQIPEGEDGIMYESTESRYATEIVNATMSDPAATTTATVTVKGGAFGTNGENYLDGDMEIWVKDSEGKKVTLAMQVQGGKLNTPGEAAVWLYNPKGATMASGTSNVTITEVVDNGDKTYTVTFANDSGVTLTGKVFATARYNSEVDLKGEYLGEVQLVMRDYHFRPRPITLGVTWTQLSELALDTSFNVSAEELLMDSAAQEIKKSLDFQSIRYADAIQRTKGVKEVVFDAVAGDSTKDSYWHTAQLIQQAIDRVGDVMLNQINRGGVSAIVGGPAAINYLKLNKGWSDKGKQAPIGGHKVGELDGIPVFKVPASVIADDELLTTWKNPTADADVAIAIGTLMAFYSTGTIQRKNLYKEAAIARFEDTQALQPKYLGRIRIDNIREISGDNV